MLENAFFWSFGKFYGDFKRKVDWKDTHNFYFMRVCKCLKQRVRKIGEQNEKYFEGVSKGKKKKNREENDFCNST